MKLLKKTASILLATTMLTAPVFSASALEASSAESDKLPASYSSVEQGYLPPVRHQGKTGICWAYATLAACEASMIINNGYDTSLDLSELHLAYARLSAQKDKMGMFDCNKPFEKDFIASNTTIDMPIMALANQQGVVLESANHGQFSTDKLHFANSNNNFVLHNDEALYAFNEAYVTDAYQIKSTNLELIKEHIIKYGVGATGISTQANFYNEETSTFYCYNKNQTAINHAVAIVGWDDNYPKEKCTTNGHTPKENGAWIIRDSYGTEKGNNGYHWISYEDNSIVNAPVMFYKLTASDTYTNTYQYDDTFQKSFFRDENWNSSFAGGVYMANIFTSQKDNETLEAVSFYTSEEYVDYTIKIYTNIKDNLNPSSGTLVTTVSGEDLLMGYHTVKLTESVALNKGEKFSVVVNLKDNQNLSRRLSATIDSCSIQKNSDYGESFFSTNGKDWVDLKASEQGNMRVKAFTNSDDTPLELQDYYNFAEGKTREEIMTELKATLEKCDSTLSNYDYWVDLSFLYLITKYFYAQQAYDNPDIFLALEYYHLNDSLNKSFGRLTPFNVKEDIKYHDTIPQWTELTNNLDSIMETLKNDIILSFFSHEEKVNTSYINYIKFAIDNGAYDSYLQNFGDIDNNSILDVDDVTTLQMLLAKSIDYDFHSYYNSDVNGDGEISVVDVATIQMYLANLIEYMPVYDKQFDSEEIDETIDLDTALAKLETAKSKAEELCKFTNPEDKVTNSSYLITWRQYNDALNVLDNPYNYHPKVIDFKARCLEYTTAIAVNNSNT